MTIASLPSSLFIAYYFFHPNFWDLLNSNSNNKKKKDKKEKEEEESEKKETEELTPIKVFLFSRHYLSTSFKLTNLVFQTLGCRYYYYFHF